MLCRALKRVTSHAVDLSAGAVRLFHEEMMLLFTGGKARASVLVLRGQAVRVYVCARQHRGGSDSARLGSVPADQRWAGGF